MNFWWEPVAIVTWPLNYCNTELRYNSGISLIFQVLGARAANAKILADSSSKDSTNKQVNGNSDIKEPEDPSEENKDKCGGPPPPAPKEHENPVYHTNPLL